MPYDPELVQPMREELTQLGVQELRTSAEVDEVLKNENETVLVVVNSVCGCAAANARPGVAMALQHRTLPDKITTVFAGVDVEATARARSYFTGYFPSSPQIALLRDGQVVFIMERHDIEGRTALDVAHRLTEAFDTYCAVPAQ